MVIFEQLENMFSKNLLHAFFDIVSYWKEILYRSLTFLVLIFVKPIKPIKLYSFLVKNIGSLLLHLNSFTSPSPLLFAKS